MITGESLLNFELRTTILPDDVKKFTQKLLSSFQIRLEKNKTTPSTIILSIHSKVGTKPKKMSATTIEPLNSI